MKKMSNERDNRELEAQVLQLVRAMVERDEELRKKYEMDNKFRFVRERLQAIFQQLEQELKVAIQKPDQQSKKNELLEDEIAVYVYLYNANGIVLSSWQNLLTPKVFYEYSVNRPIYIEKSHIEALLRSKSNKAQHAYLTVAIKAAHVIQSEAEIKDTLGSPVVKIREGSLSFDRLIGFTYNDQEYMLSDKEGLVRKS